MYNGQRRFTHHAQGGIDHASDGGAFTSVDGGERWWPLRKGLGPNPVVYSVAVDSGDPAKVYAVTADGVLGLVRE